MTVYVSPTLQVVVLLVGVAVAAHTLSKRFQRWDPVWTVLRATAALIGALVVTAVVWQLPALA